MTAPSKENEMKTKTKCSARSQRHRGHRRGRTSMEIQSRREMRSIWKNYVDNGGNMTYEQLEKKFGLRQTRGMNAWRVVKKYEEMLRKEGKI